MFDTEKYILYVFSEDNTEKFFGPFNSPQEALNWGRKNYLNTNNKYEIVIKTLYYPMEYD